MSSLQKFPRAVLAAGFLLNIVNNNFIILSQDVLRFWLSLGVDGLSVDAIHFLWENHYHKDEPLLENTGLKEVI